MSKDLFDITKVLYILVPIILGFLLILILTNLKLLTKFRIHKISILLISSMMIAPIYIYFCSLYFGNEPGLFQLKLALSISTGLLIFSTSTIICFSKFIVRCLHKYFIH